MPTSAQRRMAPLAALALLAAAGSAACDSTSTTTNRAATSATSAAPETLPTHAPATQAQLTAATLTNRDLLTLGMTVRPPLPNAAMISADAPTPLPGGACAPIAAAWQAGAPTYPSGPSTDVEVTHPGDTTVESIHLASYTSPVAASFVSALTNAVRTCTGYVIENGTLKLRQTIQALDMQVGDQAVAWQQESTAADGAQLWMSVAVVRVGDTVITVVRDHTSRTPLPAPDSRLVTVQIEKLTAQLA